MIRLQHFCRPFLSIALLLCFGKGSFASAIPLSVETVSEVVDGLNSEYVSLKGRDFEGRYFNDRNWTLSETTSRSASLSLAHNSIDGLSMDLYVFTSPVLLPDYSDDSVRAYTEKLGKAYQARGLRIQNLVTAKSSLGGPAFMGSAYWRVQFELINAETGKIHQTVEDFISIGEDAQNFRLRFLAASSALEGAGAGFERKLWDFMLE